LETVPVVRLPTKKRKEKEKGPTTTLENTHRMVLLHDETLGKLPHLRLSEVSLKGRLGEQGVRLVEGGLRRGGGGG